MSSGRVRERWEMMRLGEWICEYVLVSSASYLSAGPQVYINFLMTHLPHYLIPEAGFLT